MPGRRCRDGAIATVVSLLAALAVVGGDFSNVDAGGPVGSDARQAPPAEFGSGVIEPEDRHLIRFASAVGMEHGRAAPHR